MEEMVEWDKLPEGCIAKILSLTSPRDACRFSVLASTFRSAADSDAVWDKFLPPDCQDIISQSSGLIFRSKKELYLTLSDHPLLIDAGTKAFWLEKKNGKKCYMLAAKDLIIIWGDTLRYWRWVSLPESRFSEVAELIDVCWLEIKRKINTSILSKNTIYEAYLVFKFNEEARGFEYQAAEGWVGVDGNEREQLQNVYFDPNFIGEQGRDVQVFGQVLREVEDEDGSQYPKEREDGWLEIKLGEYNNGNENENVELEMGLMEVKSGRWKSGLVVEGIKIRPK